MRAHLEWTLRFQRDGWQVQAAEDRRVPPPEWFGECPEISDDETFYMRAFSDLATCRPMGMSPGPIPWRDILEYATVSEIDEAMFPTFNAVIREMDVGYLAFFAPKEAGNGKRPGNGGATTRDDADGTKSEVAPRRGRRRNYGRGPG